MNHSVAAVIQRALSGLESWPAATQLVFFYIVAVLQLLVPFMPADLMLMLGSCMGSLGVLPGGTWSVLVSFWLGTVSGCMILYLLGRRFGPRLLRTAMARRFFPSEKQEKARQTASRFGPAALLMSKFLPGVNSLMLVTGGIMSWPALKVLLCTGIASFVQDLILFLVGRAVGANLDAIARFVREYQQITLLLLAAVILFAVWFALRRRARRPAERS